MGGGAIEFSGEIPSPMVYPWPIPAAGARDISR
jgi:hypothetical protein